jgi:hypothetical protein
MHSEPSALQVKNPDDWEQLCCYVMNWLILTRHKTNVQFTRYGRNGQAQHGIDIITHNSSFSDVLGQAKYKSPGNAIEIEDVEETLEKTSTYPNNLTHLILLTTGSKNTKVDNLIIQKESIYTNRKNVKFKFEVFYWQDFKEHKFIPHNELIRFFPEVAQISGVFKNDPYEEAIISARKTIPEYIAPSEIGLILEIAEQRQKPDDAFDLKLIVLIQGIQKAKALTEGNEAFAANTDARRLRHSVKATGRLYEALLDYRKKHLNLAPNSEAKAWNIYSYAARELQNAYDEIMR